jgi:hypothetical protein
MSTLSGFESSDLWQKKFFHENKRDSDLFVPASGNVVAKDLALVSLHRDRIRRLTLQNPVARRSSGQENARKRMEASVLLRDLGAYRHAVASQPLSS